MTHRERVLAALSHKTPDKVPIDLGGTRSTGIVAEGYDRLKQHLGVVEENVIANRMMQTVAVGEPVLTLLDIDTRALMPGPADNGRDVEVGANKYRDEWGVERVKPEGSHYYDQVRFPLSGTITLDDVMNYPWPDPADKGRIRGLKEEAARIRRSADCALVLSIPAAFVHTSQYLRGFEDWFMDLAADEKLATALFDAILDVNMVVCEKLLKEVGDDVDVINTSDDLGLQDRLMFSQATYRNLIKPRHRKYFDLIHKLSPAKVFFHTCGAMEPLIGDLIDVGVDILNPVQVSAKGMDPVVLKQKYGKDISFWGGIDTQHLLPRGTPEDVKREVERMIDILGADGGYVLCGVHNLQPDVPVENILAMYRHAREYKGYVRRY